MNLLILIDSKTIGINLWLTPQISEHWPKYIPGRFNKILVWFKRPGTASTLIPKEGTAKEWITSSDKINNRTWNFIGI